MAAQHGSAKAVLVLVEAVEVTPDGRVRRIANDVLASLRHPATIDALCALWAAARREDLAAAIVQHGYVAAQPIHVRVLSALAANRGDLLVNDAETIGATIDALTDANAEIANRARLTLRQLVDPAATDALCARVIATGDEHASEIAVTAGYAPREPTARALFFFLTHQFESYAGLDFDQAHLRAAHETANADLRRRMAEVARVSGRIEWVHVVAWG